MKNLKNDHLGIFKTDLVLKPVLIDILMELKRQMETSSSKKIDDSSLPEDYRIAFEEGFHTALHVLNTYLEQAVKDLQEAQEASRRDDYDSEDSSDEIERKKNESKQNTWRTKRSPYRHDNGTDYSLNV